MSHFQSWGHYPQAQPQSVRPVRWRHESIDFQEWDSPVLPYAYGRSYGDSCLNDGGVVLDVKGLSRFMAFHENTGILRCEASVSLADILDVFVPRGWFPPVTPGTQFVSVGGAIANDVHGKNHHHAGTFGCHVIAFELLRSTGERILCTPEQHPKLFQATIGGLGLTGLILWADIRLKPIKSAFIATERIRFPSLDEFFNLAAESDRAYQYTVAWIDCLAGGRRQGRGLFIRGNHFDPGEQPPPPFTPRKARTIPCHLPSFCLNSFTMKALNFVYYSSQSRQPIQSLEPYDVFFYPLDALLHWNRLYGPKGFLQYQCVIPPPYEQEGMKTLLALIHQSGQGSFLAVLKKFGHMSSPGLLSFPRPGTTLALDFPFHGERTLTLLTQLDTVVRETGGAIYPAKDARMSSQDFKRFFPNYEEFLKYKDPQFSSSFWRRVMGTPSTETSPIGNHS